MISNLSHQNKVFITKLDWEKRFKGWIIKDCAIRTKDIVSFVLRKDIQNDQLNKLFDGEVPTRCTSFDIRKNLLGSSGFDTGFSFPVIGISRKPVLQTLMTTRWRTGGTWAASSEIKGLEEITPIGKTEPSKGIDTMRLKCIDGWTYAIGLFRKIYKRVDIGKWERIAEGLPILTDDDIDNGFFGFDDLDGPDESNMYAVGGHGDVWRYDGTRWHQCDFPSNEQLNTVTVAPTGEVYISGEGGNLWVGEKNSWKKIAKGYSSVLFNDSVWFNNQLWLCSGYQLKVWDGKELKTPEHNGELITHNGHMDAYDGLLVVASNYEVHAFDGNEWQCLVAPYE